MEDPEEYSWFSIEWLGELTRNRDNFEVGYAELAELMAKYPTVDAIRAHLGRIDGVGPASFDPLLDQEVPGDVVDAIAKMTEMNEWALLGVATEPSFELPTAKRHQRCFGRHSIPKLERSCFALDDRRWV